MKLFAVPAVVPALCRPVRRFARVVPRTVGGGAALTEKDKMKNDKTAVIFRTFRDGGDVVALFPFEPSDNHGHHCLSYQHVGQHGGATPDLTNGKFTRPSTPAEVCDLACELRGLGYKLRAMQRFPRNAFDVRKAKLAKLV